MATNNQFITTDLVSKYALAEFANNAPFVMTASRTYQEEFKGPGGYQVGDTIQIRRQNHFVIGDGSVATPQGILSTSENITIEHQYNALIEYTIKDLTLKIEDFNREFIQPAVQEIITKMETDIGLAAERDIYFFTGTAGTPINSFTSVDLAGTKLLEQGVNISRNAYLAMSLRDGSSLKGSLLNQFTPIFNEEIVRQSAIGHLSYFDIFQSQTIVRHVAGAGPRLHPLDVVLVNGAVASGNVIVLDGVSAEVDYFVAGDVISIAGVESVNPVGRKATGQNIQFVILQNATSAAGTVTILVSPSIISDTANPLRNVSNVIPDNAVVTMVTSHNVNVAYPERGLDIVCPPLYKLQVPYVSNAVDEETGLSLTVTQVGDVLNYQNFMRIDMLTGFKWHPQYVTRLIS